MGEIVLCPVDQSEMFIEEDSINTSYECLDCSGHLILFNRVIESEFLSADLKPTSVASFASVSCPSCKTVMLEYHYKEVLIDICSTCYAIWLDPNELEKILSMKDSDQADLLNVFDQELANDVTEKPFVLPYPDSYKKIMMQNMVKVLNKVRTKKGW